MPQGNQGQPQGRHNGGDAGGMQGVRDRLSDAAQRVQEGAGQVGQRVREGYESARDSLEHGYQQAEGMVARNPASSILVGFGVGFGLGVLLTTLLTRREDSWYERNMPDSLRHLPDRLRHLSDTIASHLPDALRR